MGSVGVEQATGFLDDPLEQLIRVGQRGDARGDVAQRPLGLCTTCEGALRALELVDQARVGDRDGRLFRETAEHGDVDVSKALGSWLITSIAPSGPASPMIGAATSPRTFACSASESVSTSCSKSAVR